MKTLLICRHAKSDWSNLYIKDYDRTLNDRGLRDAPMMGQRLLARKYLPELIISSTAKRAEQTALLISKEIGYDVKKIQWEEKLYHAPPQIIQDVLFATDNAINSIMIVCHNPGITDFVNVLANNLVDNIPTCGMAAFYIDTKRWEDYPTAKTDLYFYDFPKNDL
jgi:phosphohistidine phosphatase